MRAIVFRRLCPYSLSLMLGFFGLAGSAQAAVTWHQPTQISVGSGGQRITLFDGKFPGGASVTAADTNGDGLDEYIVGAGATGGPQVEIYSQAGTKIASWFALDRHTTAGIFVAAGDLTGDGQAEIIVSADDGFRPEVDIYSANGSRLGVFNAFEASYTGGVRVGVVPSRHGLGGKILTASGAGRDQEVRVWSWPELKVTNTWLPFGLNVAGNGLEVAGAWSDTFGEPVMVVSADRGRVPVVQVYGLDSRRLQAAWLAYDRSLKVGVNVAVRNDFVFTAAGAGGGPNVRRFTIRGHEAVSSFVYPANYRGGVRVGVTVLNGTTTNMAVPMNIDRSAGDTTVGGKSIEVILSKQELHMIENGKIISIRKVSTGKWSTPTPTGHFMTHGKTLVAYSKAYGLYMEYWMPITANGAYGLHALPFWRLHNGGKLYEGVGHLGTPVSHGCIRESVADAKSLYTWAPVGTPVTIVQ